MLYETRKILLGFRLKLTFDVTLNKDITCIFVDVSKTPTVGLLLNTIVERFKIPHTSFLTVQNCKVLPSESIYVLLDVNSVKIIVPCTSQNEVHGIQSSNVSREKSQEVSEIISSCDDVDCDVVDGKGKTFPKPKPTKKPIRDGIAATIKMLLEEEDMDKIRNECSSLSISNHISKVQQTNNQESMSTVDEGNEPDWRSEDISDLISDACSDVNVEKKKRKRKRKHSKRQTNQPLASFNESVPEVHHNLEKASRKHIRFGDEDGDENFDGSSIMETENASCSEPSLSCNNITSQKSTRIQEQQSVSAATNVKSKYNYNMEESYERPKSVLSLYSGRISKNKKMWGINSHKDPENPVSTYINLPRLSEADKELNKSKCEQVEKELATLLMCKQLNTCMEYTVQFVDEKGDRVLSKSPSTLNGSISSCQSVVNQPDQFVEKSNTSNLTNQCVKTEGRDENCAFERMEISSGDCEVLKQVKLNGKQICLRKPNGEWTVLTSEIANAELPKLDVPKENQSVVFRIVYLNEKFCPTLSDLLYGQIVSYKADTNKLAMDIRKEFIEAILNDCGEEGLPETILPISGSTFEVDLSALIEPRLIS